MKALILAAVILGNGLSPAPEKAFSTYADPQMCPSGYLPVPNKVCKLGSQVWFEQGNTCHLDPTDRKSSACECQHENHPDRIVTFCQVPKGF